MKNYFILFLLIISIVSAFPPEKHIANNYAICRDDTAGYLNIHLRPTKIDTIKVPVEIIDTTYVKKNSGVWDTIYTKHIHYDILYSIAKFDTIYIDTMAWLKSKPIIEEESKDTVSNAWGLKLKKKE